MTQTGLKQTAVTNMPVASGNKFSLLATINLMPVLAIVLLFSLLGALLWIIHVNEQEQTRLDLVRDTLWVERALQFQIANDQEILLRLADDLGRNGNDAAQFLTQAKQLLTSDPAIVAIDWLNPEGVLQAFRLQNGLTIASESHSELRQQIAGAKDQIANGALVAIGPFRFGDGMAFGLVAPVNGNTPAGGVLVAVTSFDRMLNLNIPWWIGEKRAVDLRNHEGNLLASRSKTSVDPQAQSHTIAFGAQPAGLFISLFAIRAPTNFTRDGLIGAIVLLGILAVGGLLARESHLRKRRAAEREVKREHAFRKAMEDALTVGMRARDLEGRIIYVNQAFCQMTGYDSAYLIGRGPPMPYWLPDEMEKTTAIHDAVLAGAPPADGVELKFRRRDGQVLTALVYEAPLIDAEGRQNGWMGSFLDITERKQAAELARRQADQIQTTSRLVLIGEMASILAHDLNQPLATIASYQTGLMNHLANGSISNGDIVATLAKVGDAAQRAGQIIRRVQDFVKRNEPRFERTNIGELVARIVDVFQHEPQSPASRIALNAGPDVCISLCDSVLIEQVVINLLRNADEAMANLPKRKRRIDVSIAEANGQIEVQVADQGHGIPHDMAGDIFRPFVSTKPGGMGLGLTICRSVLEAHSSRLACSTRAGGGSVFRFRLTAAAP